MNTARPLGALPRPVKQCTAGFEREKWRQSGAVLFVKSVDKVVALN